MLYIVIYLNFHVPGPLMDFEDSKLPADLK